MKYPSMLDRIIANSVLSDTSYFKGSWCWLWTGAYRKHRSSSYGVLNVWCKKEKKVAHLAAHRASILASGRRLGPKQVARHKCDNPMCVNPAHLVGGTQSQNMQDKFK